MNKLLTTILLFAMLVPITHAITVTDDFSTYSNNFVILSDTNSLDITSIDQDANKASIKATALAGDGTTYNLNWVDLNAITVDVNVLQNAANASRMILRLDQNFNLADYNASGRLHFVLNIDSNNTTGMRVDLRLGSGTARYFEYRKAYPDETSWWVGRHDIVFDLNNALVQTGSPAFTDINMAWIIVNHDAGQTDFNWTINGIWVEKVNNFSDGAWVIENPSTNPQGIALVNPNNQLVLNTIDRQSYGYHGRIFNTGFDSIDLSTYQVDFQADVNVVDSNWGVRTMFDYIDGDDFTACFIFYASPTSVRYGVEQWVNNVRDFNQVTAASTYGANREMRCVTSGSSVTLYIDDVAQITDTFAGRRDGRVAIETFSQFERHGGKIRIDNVIISASQTTAADPIYNIGTTNPIFGAVVIIFAIVLIALFAGLAKSILEGAFQIDDLGSFFATAIFLFIIIIIFLQLYFRGS